MSQLVEIIGAGSQLAQVFLIVGFFGLRDRVGVLEQWRNSMESKR